MKEKSRYDTSDIVDARIEPGSGGRVLKNLLGIKRKREMDQVEGREQRRALDELIRIYDKDHRFTAADVRKIHQLWLGKVYEWAGSYRQVNVSKGDFMFAAATQIPKLMAEFERGPLRQFTPCRFSNEKVANALAVVHVELADPSVSRGKRQACPYDFNTHGLAGWIAVARVRQHQGKKEKGVFLSGTGGDGPEL